MFSAGKPPNVRSMYTVLVNPSNVTLQVMLGMDGFAYITGYSFAYITGYSFA